MDRLAPPILSQLTMTLICTALMFVTSTCAWASCSALFESEMLPQIATAFRAETTPLDQKREAIETLERIACSTAHGKKKGAKKLLETLRSELEAETLVTDYLELLHSAIEESLWRIDGNDLFNQVRQIIEGQTTNADASTDLIDLLRKEVIFPFLMIESRDILALRPVTVKVAWFFERLTQSGQDSTLFQNFLTLLTSEENWGNGAAGTFVWITSLSNLTQKTERQWKSGIADL